MHQPTTDVTVIDFFAGYGGASAGITDAGGEVVLAANHDPHVMEIHAQNFPNVDHVIADLADTEARTYRDPANFPAADVVWASPSCTNHSLANSKKVYAQGPTLFSDHNEPDAAHINSEKSRTTMLCPLRYADKHQPRAVIMENVVEVARWGPNKDGTTWLWWLSEWDRLGYRTNVLSLNSQFFPDCPQSRDRVYIVCWLKGDQAPNLDFRPAATCDSATCDGQQIHAVQCWTETATRRPGPNIGKYRQSYIYRCPHCGHTVEPHTTPAFRAIDWHDHGPTIGERTRPLARKTLDRIKRGIARYRNYPPVIIDPTTNHAYMPFLMKGAGNTHERPGQWRGKHPTVDPIGSLTTTNEWAIAAHPFLTEMRGGGSATATRTLIDPMHTITAGGLHHGFAMTVNHSTDQGRYYHHRPLPTIATTNGLGVVQSAFTKINGAPTDTTWHGTHHPLNTVTSRDTHGLVTITNQNRKALAAIPTSDEGWEQITDDMLHDVSFRMLRPKTELRAAMAFAPDWDFGTANNTQAASGLGNAVTPPVAKWIFAQVVGRLTTATPRPTSRDL